ncbi:MAG: selenide, water dikinase SelD [Myxococcota bacterium]
MQGGRRARSARGRAAGRRPSPDGRTPSRPTRTVVLVGGGHAHVQILRRWAMDPPEAARLVVVLDRPAAVYSGMVPGFVAGDYAQRELEIDLVPLARRAGASLILAAATDLDPARGQLELAGRPPIAFDVASLDVGSSVRDLDLPGVAEHALSTRPIARFVETVDARLAALARDGRRASARPARVLVVGGGAAGCEIAFTLEARLRHRGPPVRVAVVTSEPALLAGAPAAVTRKLARIARERGIAIHPAARIARVESDGALTAAGERIEADLVVWATGAAPIDFPPRAGPEGRAPEGRAPLARDRDGFLEVRSTLQLIGYENVFAVGDCARLVEHRWVPRAGVYAVRQGPVLDRNLRALLAGRPLAPYRPQRDFLSLLNLGDRRALGAKWGIAVAGRAMFRLKDRIDRAFMRRFQPLEDPAVWARAVDAARFDAMPCGGCAAKLGAATLEAALAGLPPAPRDPSVVAGIAAREDVAVTRRTDGGLVLHNIDAIRAFCDDPWLVGRVAAANATSDLFAKGGRPRHAQALIGLPETDSRTMQRTLEQTLLGIRATLDALGITLIGGHTMTSEVLSVGLAVTGDARDAGEETDRVLWMAGARPGDGLWLTKPLGTGVVLAADMRGLARGPWLAATQASMVRANAAAARCARASGARAATDVTGFGLAGHLADLLRADGLVARLERSAIPLLPGAAALFARGLRSQADAANRAAFAPLVAGASQADGAWLFDPQTSGGLLFALPRDAGPALLQAFAAAAEPAPVWIGRVESGAGPGIRIVGEAQAGAEAGETE